MNIAGRFGVSIGICFPIMTTASLTLANEKDCNFQGLVTVKKFSTVKHFERLPQNAVLKVQLIEAAILDVDAPVIAGGDIDVSGLYFPLKFNITMNCEKMKHTIMPSFDIRVERGDKLLFINETMHPYSSDETLQKIELKKIY